MDPQTFTERTELLKYRLYRVAYLYLNNESLALDAVDEAVYLGLRALRQLRQAEYFDTWLTRIVINQCKKELRRRKREQPAANPPENSFTDYDSLPLKEAIGKLPAELREVIILRYFAGYTLAETAQCLSIPPGTAATRQRRGLRLLKLELSEEDSFGTHA